MREDSEFLQSLQPTPPTITVKGIRNTYDPHPYCLTIEHMSQILSFKDKDVIRKKEEEGLVQCGMYTDGRSWQDGHCPITNHVLRCLLPYSEHKRSRSLVLERYADPKYPTTTKQLEKINKWIETIKPLLKEHGIDGLIIENTYKN